MDRDVRGFSFLYLIISFSLSHYLYRDTKLNMRMIQSQNSNGCHGVIRTHVPLKVRSTACVSDARSQPAVCVQTGR